MSTSACKPDNIYECLSGLISVGSPPPCAKVVYEVCMGQLPVYADDVEIVFYKQAPQIKYYTPIAPFSRLSYFHFTSPLPLPTLKPLNLLPWTTVRGFSTC
jgi:hypothetical protein